MSGGRIAFAPFSIASSSRFKRNKYAANVPKPTIRHVLSLRQKNGEPEYVQMANGEIRRNLINQKHTLL